MIAAGVGLALAGCGDENAVAGGTPAVPAAESASAGTPANAPEAGAPELIPPDAVPIGSKVPVAIETSKGTIELELYPQRSPVTVKNFVKYAKNGHYKGTIFHRVIPGFMVQGGGMNPDMKEKPTDPEIKNEAANGLKNTRGTIAMARKPDPDSATAQFFINVSDNVMLDHRSQSPSEYGYCVFGRVTKGMDVVDKIVNVPVTTKGSHENVPVEPVLIRTVRVSKPLP